MSLSIKSVDEAEKIVYALTGPFVIPPETLHTFTGTQCLVGTIGESVRGSHPHFMCSKCGYVPWSEVDENCKGWPLMSDARLVPEPSSKEGA